MPKTNWRNTLLWASDIIDVDYWLGYANEGSGEVSAEWTDVNTALYRARYEWDDNYNSDNFPGDEEYMVSDKMMINARNFAEQFVELHGKINANIILAYFTQES